LILGALAPLFDGKCDLVEQLMELARDATIAIASLARFGLSDHQFAHLFAPLERACRAQGHLFRQLLPPDRRGNVRLSKARSPPPCVAKDGFVSAQTTMRRGSR
jgi:hypothetical protein